MDPEQQNGQPNGQPQQAPPDPALTFTQADSNRLQQLQSSFSAVTGQVDKGELHPEEGEQAKQIIQKLMQPLTAKQAQAQQAATQQRRTQMMDETAAQEAMQQHNAEFRAQGFAKRIVEHVNPETGETAHLFEHRPNEWKQIEWPSDKRRASHG